MSLGAPRILIAEDDRELRRLIAEGLREDGYEVIEAESGTELLERLSASVALGGVERTPSLIVSDIRMPGVTGIEVLEDLSGAELNIPFIVITAFGDRETHDAAARLGASAMLDKPFRLKDLRRVVRSFRSPYMIMED